MIVEDKKQIDWNDTKQMLAEWLHSSWYTKSKEVKL